MALSFFVSLLLLYFFYKNKFCIIFSINVGEKIEEPKDSMTFISDEELNDDEENVVLHTMLKDDEKVEEPKQSMTFSSIEEVCSY
jgi:hypothetical protein